MKLTTIFYLGIMALLSACATPKYNYAPLIASISEPPIDSVNLSQVGDTLLRQGNYTEQDAIYLATEARSSWAYTIYPGYYLKHGDDEVGEYYLPSNGDEGGRVDKAALADPWKSVMAKKDRPILCVVTVFNVAACGDETSFERRKKAILTQDSFQQTLIYSGKEKWSRLFEQRPEYFKWNLC